MADVDDRGIPNPRSENQSSRNRMDEMMMMKKGPPSLEHEDVPQPDHPSNRLRSNDDPTAYYKSNR